MGLHWLHEIHFVTNLSLTFLHVVVGSLAAEVPGIGLCGGDEGTLFGSELVVMATEMFSFALSVSEIVLPALTSDASVVDGVLRAVVIAGQTVSAGAVVGPCG